MLISPEEIKKSLSSSQWQYLNGKIIKKYDFETYLEGVSFVQKIAELGLSLTAPTNLKIFRIDRITICTCPNMFFIIYLIIFFII